MFCERAHLQSGSHRLGPNKAKWVTNHQPHSGKESRKEKYSKRQWTKQALCFSLRHDCSHVEDSIYQYSLCWPPRNHSAAPQMEQVLLRKLLMVTDCNRTLKTQVFKLLVWFRFESFDNKRPLWLETVTLTPLILAKVSAVASWKAPSVLSHDAKCLK